MPRLPTLSDPSLIHDSAYIDGHWVSADDGNSFTVLDPSDGTVLGHIPALGEKETHRAILAASHAYPTWKGLRAQERSIILRRWHDLILAHQEDLALIMGAEEGKPHAEARAEVAYGASFVEWFAEEAKRVYGDVIPHAHHQRRIIVLKEAIGVVAAITPWNFPIAMVTRKCAPALAAGCTVVLKPAEDTPLCALALGDLAERAGIPAGVFNIVTACDPVPIAVTLTKSPLVRKLSFTGSTEVGQHLMQQCAHTLKKLSLELGGNAPFIVFDDGDMTAAVQGAMISKFRNAGQTCVCPNRFLIHDSVYDRFSEELTTAVRSLKVGQSRDPEITQGPLINANALSKVSALVEDAVQKGARIVTGGDTHGRHFYTPTVLTEVTSEMRLAKEEIFGPVAALFRFHTEDQAIAMANDTEYGLAAYVYARDLARVWRVLETLEYGIVAINEGLISSEAAPFGGVKYSGFGREGSKYGIDEFITMKYVCLGGLR